MTIKVWKYGQGSMAKNLTEARSSKRAAGSRTPQTPQVELCLEMLKHFCARIHGRQSLRGIPSGKLT